MEYTTFREHLQKLSEAISDNLPELTEKLLASSLISKYTAAEVKNEYISKHARASKILMVLLARIQVDKKTFYTVGHIMDSIPGLQSLAREIFKLDDSSELEHMGQAAK